MAGSHYQLTNLVCILDKNPWQMTGDTRLMMNIDPVADKLRAFGWNVIEVEDGNDMAQVWAAFDQLPERDCTKQDKPTFIICYTLKGKGLSFMHGNYTWYVCVLGEDASKSPLAVVEKLRKVCWSMSASVLFR